MRARNKPMVVENVPAERERANCMEHEFLVTETPRAVTGPCAPSASAWRSRSEPGHTRRLARVCPQPHGGKCAGMRQLALRRGQAAADQNGRTPHLECEQRTRAHDDPQLWPYRWRRADGSRSFSCAELPTPSNRELGQTLVSCGGHTARCVHVRRPRLQTHLAAHGRSTASGCAAPGYSRPRTSCSRFRPVRRLHRVGRQHRPCTADVLFTSICSTDRC